MAKRMKPGVSLGLNPHGLNGSCRLAAHFIGSVSPAPRATLDAGVLEHPGQPLILSSCSSNRTRRGTNVSLGGNATTAQYQDCRIALEPDGCVSATRFAAPNTRGTGRDGSDEVVYRKSDACATHEGVARTLDSGRLMGATQVAAPTRLLPLRGSPRLCGTPLTVAITKRAVEAIR